jgi:hypothetical protein
MTKRRSPFRLERVLLGMLDRVERQVDVEDWPVEMPRRRALEYANVVAVEYSPSGTHAVGKRTS